MRGYFEFDPISLCMVYVIRMPLHAEELSLAALCSTDGVRVQPSNIIYH